jgi:hypothetical protein
MKLNQLFSSVAIKQLVSVDLPNNGSNQHEINGVIALHDFFQTTDDIKNIPINWFYFSDNGDPVSSKGIISFYDARRNHTRRTEWRLYYSSDFINHAKVGDYFILIHTTGNEYIGVLIDQSSSWLYSIFNIFNIDARLFSNKFIIISDEILIKNLSIVERQFFEQLGCSELISGDEDIERVANLEMDYAIQHGLSFPSTTRLATAGRSLVVEDQRDLDDLLLNWLEKETQLFYFLEKRLVETKLNVGFSSVEDFVSYSLTVQNRRKSRRGLSLQNHLEALFIREQIRFEAQTITENKNKPDFIFPSSSAYHNDEYSSEKLVMLAAKSSCKDRWRQILTEANRIPQKHLCTLDQAISLDQFDEMHSKKVVLVIPHDIRKIYPNSIQNRIYSITDFLKFVKTIQI